MLLVSALARALKYNLDYKVELLEKSPRIRQLDLSHHSLLPKLVASSGFAGRNKYSGGRNREILTSTTLGAQSLQSSTSQERDATTSDLTLSWDILDFDLS